MSTSNSDKCPRCGTPVRPHAEDSLCAACLMAAGLAGPEDATLASPSGRDAPETHSESFPRRLGGYRLDGLLGTGGMGTVYEAEELETGRRVAVKVLAQRIDSPEMRQRFLREGRLAASVNHPNSLYVFGSEEIDDAPVITMEVADAGTLNDRLARRGHYPLTDAVDAILDVVAGLEAAYTEGVLHRDVKPSNCFVGPDGAVKVGDYGISVSTHAHDDSYVTSSGLIIGTPAYAAPEQLRGDSVDLRADIYSVGATLFTLVTGKAPFEGSNAVQVVANAANQAPPSMSSLREGVPPELDKVVLRCLAKDRDARFASYAELRDALLPFSSQRAEPASTALRGATGWIDYLVAFLVPYVVLSLAVGKEKVLVIPFIEGTLSSYRYYLILMAFGVAYFTLVEGLWGAGLGKRFKRLTVVGPSGRTPGLLRAATRIIVPLLLCEGLRLPFLHVAITTKTLDAMSSFEVLMLVAACTIFPWVPTTLFMFARPSNGYAALWDRLSGTRVVLRPRGVVRPRVEAAPIAGRHAKPGAWLGPYKVEREIIPGECLLGSDPVLRRQVWLLLRKGEGPSKSRRAIARPERTRWLQVVTSAEGTWDAFEARAGTPLATLSKAQGPLPWSSLRLWLHDLASELWQAEREGTLPSELGLDHVWITTGGRAILLDAAWPIVETPAERAPVRAVTGQLAFLSRIAELVDPTSLPLHARSLVDNIRGGRIEKLSFVTGTLRGLLDKPTDVSRAVRAGSIFMLPFYTWIMLFVGAHQGAEWLYARVGSGAHQIAMTMALVVLSTFALLQLLGLVPRSTFGQSLFQLAVVDDSGKEASRARLFTRWALVWPPLLSSLALGGWITRGQPATGFILASALILAFLGGAAYSAWHPKRGLHDRLAGTWVVRR